MDQDLNYLQKWINQTEMPCFKVDASNIIVLKNPEEFYSQLKVFILFFFDKF